MKSTFLLHWLTCQQVPRFPPASGQHCLTHKLKELGCAEVRASNGMVLPGKEHWVQGSCHNRWRAFFCWCSNPPRLPLRWEGPGCTCIMWLKMSLHEFFHQRVWGSRSLSLFRSLSSYFIQGLFYGPKISFVCTWNCETITLHLHNHIESLLNQAHRTLIGLKCNVHVVFIKIFTQPDSTISTQSDSLN